MMLDFFKKHIDDETSMEFAEIGYGRKYIHIESGDIFEKDCAGQWWVQSDHGERGPFNSLEHACECMFYVYEG